MRTQLLAKIGSSSSFIRIDGDHDGVGILLLEHPFYSTYTIPEVVANAEPTFLTFPELHVELCRSPSLGP